MDFLFFGLWVIFGLGLIGVIITFLIRMFTKKKPRWKIYVPVAVVLFIGLIVSMVGFGSQPEVQRLAAEKTESERKIEDTSPISKEKEENSKVETSAEDTSKIEKKDTASREVEKEPEVEETTPEKKIVPVKKETEKQKKTESKKPVSIEEKAKTAAYKIFGLSDDPIEETVRDIEFDEDDKSLMITVLGEDGWSDKSIGLGFYEDSTALYREFADDKQISEIWISILFPMKDDHGNLEDEEVMGTWMSRETLNKIEWKTFDYQNLLDVVDGKTIYPQFVQ